jgi:hypothetical protein
VNVTKQADSYPASHGHDSSQRPHVASNVKSAFGPACVEREHEITRNATHYTRTSSFLFHHPLPPANHCRRDQKLTPSRHSSAPLAQPSLQIDRGRACLLRETDVVTTASLEACHRPIYLLFTAWQLRRIGKRPRLDWKHKEPGRLTKVFQLGCGKERKSSAIHQDRVSLSRYDWSRCRIIGPIDRR